MIEIDPATIEWRELFSKAVEADSARKQKILEEIRELVRIQNGQVRTNQLAIAARPSEERVRANEVAIAGLRTWVAVVGGVGGIGGLIAVILAWVMN